MRDCQKIFDGGLRSNYKIKFVEEQHEAPFIIDQYEEN